MSGSEDFASMFEASLQAKRLERGQMVEGVVVRIGPEVALVDVGAKSEAVIDVAELKDEAGAVEVNVGDRLQATVVSTSGGITLSRRLVRRAATERQIESAYQAGLPVEGTVQAVVKGGYEVRVGHSRAFCPLSQIDIVRTNDPDTHVGRSYTFQVVEFGERGRNIVVSRRALLEAEQQARADDIRRAIVPGAVLSGRVVSVRDFGTFVDLGGGIQGLVHVSEMSWSRGGTPGAPDGAASGATGRELSPATLFNPGDEVTVKVLRIGEDPDRISLSIKQLTDDPWTTAADRYHEGEVHTGRVTRVAEFGAFIELEPGVEALAHVSTFPPTGRRDEWRQTVPVGLTAPVEILTVDREKKRIGVALVPEGAARARGFETITEITPGARITGKVERHERYGVFVFLAPGRVGLMPMSETGVDRDVEVAKRFPVGSDIEVIILEVDESAHRIRVSHKAVRDAGEAAEVREYTSRTEGRPQGFGGSLADKLRGALDSNRRS